VLARLVHPVSAIAGAISICMGVAQLRFVDRVAAGDILAEILWQTIPAESKKELVVLGIPRGGAIVAKQVSARFDAELGLVVSKKILVPGSEEDAIGALVAGEPEYLDLAALYRLKITQDKIATSISQAREEVEIRHRLYMDKGQPLEEINGKTVILVDDGAATGSTLVASARSVRKRDPSLLVVAVPVATRAAVSQLKQEADKVVTVVEAKKNFRAVGQFYKSFIPVAHDDVLKVLASAKKTQEHAV
jgi:putative phosphoribosyl transferase